MPLDKLKRPIMIEDKVLVLKEYASTIGTIKEITDDRTVLVENCATNTTTRHQVEHIIVITGQIRINHKQFPENYI